MRATLSDGRSFTTFDNADAPGVVVANGPFLRQSDESYRGMSIFTCDPVEAARLSGLDPSVVAGRLTYDVMEWWVAAGSLGFPSAPGPVGDRRTLPRD